ncbi:MAG: hypothetical protein IT520_09465 [Burkholderiales bacterium]|nr:hypothetical protein [Burkholderiales bacterium]
MRGDADRFDFRARGDGSVAIERSGRIVTVLRSQAASRFLAAVSGAGDEDRQREMARVTGNYRRGNERVAGAHPRRRG